MAERLAVLLLALFVGGVGASVLVWSLRDRAKNGMPAPAKRLLGPTVPGAGVFLLRCFVGGGWVLFGVVLAVIAFRIG